MRNLILSILSVILFLPIASIAQQNKETIQVYQKPCFVSIQDKHVLNGNKITHIDADTIGAFINISVAQYGTVVIKVPSDKKMELVKDILRQLEKCK